MTHKRITLTTKFISMVSLFLLLANGFLGSILAHQSRTAMKSLIDARMLDVANTAADMLSGDDLANVTESNIGSPGYKAIYDTLRSFQDNIDLEFIYTIRRESDGHFIFVIDPAPENVSEYGEEPLVTDTIRKAYTGTPAVDVVPYTDSYGRFYSAFSPVFDSAGTVAGIVGVDFSAAWYDQQISKNMRTILFCCLISLFAGAVIVFFITARIQQNFSTINTEIANLAGDVDKITQEITGKTIEKHRSSGDDIQEVSDKIALMRKELQHYIERRGTEAENMITAMASDYRSVYYIDLDKDTGICYRKGTVYDAPFNEGDHIPYRATFVDYANRFVTDEYRDRFLAFIEPESIRKGLSNSKMITLRYLMRKNGKERYEMLRMAGVRKAEERVDGKIHIVGVGFTDIDEEMRASLVKSQALSDALRAAEEASKAKTAFLSNMSHEIRTPMNAIIGLDSLALHEPDISEKTRDYLQKIGSSADHLLALINDILDMSRIESGRMVIQNEEFAFSKLMEQVNTIFSGQCEEKGLVYTCHITGTLDDYYIGDDMKIRQILINILGNAVKFTPAGGSVTFAVEKTASFDKKSTLQFTISDTGIGMSREYLPKLFETFTQENPSATTKYGSSGLGMAITKSIVEMMNGKIEVESEKGVGTTFTVSVTLQDSERTNAVVHDEIEIRPQDMNVLVVDDDTIALEHAKLVLEKAGIKVETALSGKDAVEMVTLRHARREPYSMIIIDWQMPDLNGIETARLIRASTGDESAIIILTAYNWDDIFEEAMQAGVDSFIAKPIFSGNLLDEFKIALKKKRAITKNSAKKADLAGKRILLAEDMEVNAQIMMEVLSMRGMIAERAENGRIAVDMFKEHEVGWYDAVLMDMRMPEMNGLEAAAAIRKLDRADAKQIPIIALTANAFDEDVQRSLQAGMNAHLSKPVQPDVLFATLEGML